MTDVGLYFETNDDGEKADEDLFCMYTRSYETVMDLNCRLRGQLARCPEVNHIDTRCRLVYGKPVSGLHVHARAAQPFQGRGRR